jgi:hypothetical protein
MRRVGSVLAISAVALALIPSPASAQTEAPTLGCIPTSDTPFDAGVSGPFPNPDYRVVLFQSVPGVFFQIYATTDDVSSDGLTTFHSSVAPGFYQVAFAARGDFIVLGTVQIGNCTPTSKEQCKNGGWRNFPQFTNEGQCVKFVNRGP